MINRKQRTVMSEKDKELLETLSQKIGFAEALGDVLGRLSDEELNREIIDTFTTSEIISLLDECGDLGEAAEAYYAKEGTSMVEELIAGADKAARRKLVSSLLGITTLWTLEDFIEKIKELYR